MNPASFDYAAIHPALFKKESLFKLRRDSFLCKISAVMSNRASNHQGKGSTPNTRRPKAKMRKRLNKEKARVRREERRVQA